jgi:spermidine synthase
MNDHQATHEESKCPPGAPGLPAHDFGAVTMIVLLGLQTMVVQIILIRESLVIFQGNELCFGVVFAAWLAGIAVGANVGARIASKVRRGNVLAVGILLVMVVVPPVQVYLIRVQRDWLHIPPGELAPFTSLLLSSLLTITPFSLLVGFIFPLAYRLFRRWEADPASAVGRLYVVEATGSVLGGILFTFYVAGKMDAFSALTITGLTLSAMVILYASDKEEDRTAEIIPVTGCYLAFLFAAFLLARVPTQKQYDAALARWQSFTPSLDYCASADSRYENLVVARKGDQYSLFGDGQLMFSFPDEPTYAEQAGRVLTEHPNPKRVLLLGGGIGGLLRQMLLHPVSHIDYVELDPALILLVDDFLPFDEREVLADPRVRVWYEDGRRFVKRAPEELKKSKSAKYDLVFVNLPDPSTAMINRFYTREFFQEVKKILAPGGVLATRISSAIGYMGEEVGNYTSSLNRTLRSVFAEVIASPGDTNYYFACDTPGVVTFDIPTLMKRYRERKVGTKYFSEYMFPTLLQPDLVKNLAKQLEARQDTPINSDFRPVTYFFNLMLWDQFAGGQLRGFYHWVRRASMGWIALFVCLFAAVRAAYALLTPQRGASHTKFNLLAAIAGVGLAGLSWELVLIFAFQNIYGYVYERVGLIIAAFMVGLVVGGAWANGRARTTAENAARMRGLRALILAVAVYSAVLPLLIWVLSRGQAVAPGRDLAATVLVILTGIAGLLTGAPFPLATRLYIERAGNASRGAGLMDSLDHLGAFVGALVTGVLLIPLLGIVQTCLTIALVNAACWGLLLLARRDVGAAT